LGILTIPLDSVTAQYAELSQSSLPSDATYRTTAGLSGEWLDALQEAIALVDAGGRVREWNKAMTHLSGVTKKDAVGRRLFTLLPADFEMNLAEPIRQAQSQQLPSEGAFTLRHADDELFTFQFRVVKPAAENPRGVVLVSLIDKSDRDRLRRKLKRQEQLSVIGLLLPGIAHELTGPLETICATIDGMLVSTSDPLNEKIEQGLHQIVDEVFRIRTLSNNMIALAHHQTPPPIFVDAHALLRETVALLEINLNRRPVCNLRLANGAALIAGDPLMLRRVFSNLLKTAVDAAGDDAIPLVETSFDGTQSVVIRIEDRGFARTAKSARMVMDRLRHAQPAVPGSEAAIFFNKRIIEAHQGTIKAEDHSSRGTVYTVTLPLQTDVSPDEEIA